MAFTAVFDACVLYPAPVRDLLLWLARTNLFRARWTESIHREWVENLLRNRPELERSRLQRTCALMDAAVEDCLVTNYEALIPGLDLPDPDDRHVLAAALRCHADIIVTFNLKDFPAAILGPLGIEPQHPDTFVRHTLDLDPVALVAVRHCRASLKNPSVSASDYLSTLDRSGLPETATFLSAWAELI